MAQMSDRDAVKLMQQCIGKCHELQLALFERVAIPTREQALELAKEAAIENMLIELAAAARPLARSYRNFDVGTAFIAIRRPQLYTQIHWYVRFAANTKEEGGEKYCGEQRLFDKALEKQVQHIVAIGIVAQPQNDHGSGRKGITLEMCERCRWRARGLMREHHPIVEPDTLLISANAEMLWARKHQTIADVHAMHCEALDS